AVSRAFDDKSCVWIGARVLEELKAQGGVKADYTFAGTVQEEIGLRGGKTSGEAIDADINIAIDVTHATDYPQIEKTKYGDIKLGAGPVITRGPNIDPVLFDKLVEAAEKAGIPYQIEADARPTGTDANAMQVNNGGKITGLISVPLRYMHTPTEVIALSDLENAVKLMVQFISDLDDKVDFPPMVNK
ncbi:MAG: M20/M25/M40 family metallo-hydrolase, partial [Coriobacteriia bacterium]|nr:M20/M25/M40 family metallo-hydrolase [Coriobacteriia bacterium]